MIFFLPWRELKKLKKQFAELGDKVQILQSRLDEMRQECRDNTNIENVYVERINVDRLEFSNNFGAMGIRELGGTLNVGVNYPDEKIKPGKDKTTPLKEKRETKESPSKQQPSPGNKTADPLRDQGNQTWPFLNKKQVKQDCPDNLKNQSDIKEASHNIKEQNNKKYINKNMKLPKKQPVCNIYFGE